MRFALVENEQRIGQATRFDSQAASPRRRSFRGRADLSRVLGEDALRVARRRRRPGGEAARELVVGDVEVEAALLDVEHDLVAVADAASGPPRSLRRDVADHQAVRRAREAAVGDQRDLVAEPFADERRGDVQHLAHAGAAGGAFVADHDHVAGLDRARLDGGEAVLLGVEDARGAAVVEPLVAGELDDAALGASEPRRIARPPVGLSGVS